MIHPGEATDQSGQKKNKAIAIAEGIC